MKVMIDCYDKVSSEPRPSVLTITRGSRFSLTGKVLKDDFRDDIDED